MRTLSVLYVNVVADVVSRGHRGHVGHGFNRSTDLHLILVCDAGHQRDKGGGGTGKAVPELCICPHQPSNNTSNYVVQASIFRKIGHERRENVVLQLKPVAGKDPKSENADKRLAKPNDKPTVASVDGKHLKRSGDQQHLVPKFDKDVLPTVHIIRSPRVEQLGLFE